MATQLKEQDTPVVDTTANDEPQAPERDFEVEARAQGWKPETEFEEGEKRPTRFKTAEEFVNDAENILPIVNKQNKAMKRELDELKQLVKRVVKSEQNAYQNALEQIRIEQREAVRSGDEAAFDDLEKRADKLRKDMVDDIPGETFSPEAASEAFDEFREANAWYDKANLASATETEVEARLYADRVADKLMRKTEGKLPPKEFFERIAKDVEAKFPLLKSRAARAKPVSDVAGVSRPNGRSNARVGANLPADAKEHAERYMRMGIFKVKTKEEAWNMMAKDYDWSKA